MSLILSGSDGLSDIDGSASTPAIRGTDANTGIFFPAADTIAFAEGGVEVMRINSSGNVGIGTTSPAVSGLEISRATGSATPTPVELRLATTTNAADWSTTNPWGRLSFYNADTSGSGPKIHAAIDATASSTAASTSNLDFAVNVTGSNTLRKTLSFTAGASTTSTIFYAGSEAEAMRIDSSGNVGIGTTTAIYSSRLSVAYDGNAQNGPSFADNRSFAADVGGAISLVGKYNTAGDYRPFGVVLATKENATDGNSAGTLRFLTNANGANTTERARIDSGGNLLVGTTNTNPAENNVAGTAIGPDGRLFISAMANEAMRINRGTNDGTLVFFHQAGTAEGSISVSGTTVSYNGGNLSRWAQMLSKPDLLKGTVMSNLDEMNVYTDAEGNPVENEQLNKVKVSDVEGDVNVAGVFVNWTYDEAHQVDEINMAMTGDMIIRIAQGVVVQKGDLLMSAGDGTAKPQEDDIVRSKTVAKVTSNHVTCTYADGSYCVPCVLMAC